MVNTKSIDWIKNFSVFIVDFDGTLIILETDWQFLKHNLKEYCKLNFNFDEPFKNLDESLFKIKRLYGEIVFNKLLEIVSFYEINGFRGKRVDKVISFLSSLPRDKKIAIFSSNCRKTIEKIIEDIKLDISFIVAKEDVDMPKPSGEGINKILKYFKVVPNKVLFIGDSDNDLEAGRDAQVKTILWQEYF